MQPTLLDFVVGQWSAVPAVESADLSGKTVVIAGANTGIGFETAKHFARMNPARLVLACRSEGNGQAAASEIVSETGCATCVSWRLDLADFASVIKFAERLERECDRLDVLVMNAATAPMQYEETLDGWESSLKVNHLGTALLSLLLLPRLVDTGKRFGSTSRLVIVTSGMHYWLVLPKEVKESSNPIATLNASKYESPSSATNRYSETKLLNVFFTRALHDHLRSAAPLTVNAVCPGFCYSNLRRNYRGLSVVLFNVIMETCLARSAEKGARQLVYAAVGERDEDRMKGAYINNCKVVEPSDFVVSEGGKTMQDTVWRETIEILARQAPRLRSIIQAYLV